MERTVKLLSFSPEIELQDACSVHITCNLKYMPLLTKEGCLRIYSITRGKDSILENNLVWQSSSKLHSYKLSEDGSLLMLVCDSLDLLIYELYGEKVELVTEKDGNELSGILQKNGIVITETTKMIPLTFHNESVVLSIDNAWIASLRWYPGEPMVCTNKIELASCVTVTTCRNVVYALSLGGNLSAYSLEDGIQLGVVNLYSLVPRTYTSSEVQVFSYMTISLDGSFLAVADRASQVFVAHVKSHFLPPAPEEEEEEERWDCGASIRSASSGTSHISARTTSSLLRVPSMLGDNVSVRSLDLMEKEKVSSYATNWSSYLKALKEQLPTTSSANTAAKRKGEQYFTALRHVGIPPMGLHVQSLHLSSAGLSVWYTQPGVTQGGIYRLYDPVTGAFITETPVPNNALVIGGGFLGLVDAFLSSCSLWIFLGNLSRDVLVNKLLHCVETEAIGQLLQGEEWGDLVVPLSTLASGLKQQQMDVARLALGLHAQALKTFVTLPVDDCSFQE